MTRSSDLDTIAPDDLIPQAPTLAESTPPQTKKTKPVILPPAQAPPMSSVKDRISQIMGHSRHFLSSSLINPQIFDFQERDSGETIHLVLRQHWFTNVKWIVGSILMIIAPILISFVPLLDFFPGNYRFIFILFWYIITFVYALESFLSWYFDVYIVTSDRVVDIDFNNLLSKSFAEADLAMIQDLSYLVQGIPQTIFNYATIRIQTASEIPEIEFENVTNPEKIVKVLRELKQAREGRP